MCVIFNYSYCFLFFSRVKDVTGYDPEMMLDASINIDDFFHPADVNVMLSLKNNGKYIHVHGLNTHLYVL